MFEQGRLGQGQSVGKLDEELRELRRKLAQARQPLDVIEEVEEKIYDLEDDVSVPVERVDVRGSLPERDGQQEELPIRLGDKVRLKSLGTHGVVSAIAKEEAEVQIGVMRIRTRLVELERISAGKKAEETVRKGDAEERARYQPTPGVELDLRGMRAEEALERLDDYMDSAYLSQMPYVRIIHGKGTGKLRKVVHKSLQNNGQVKSYELGKDGEGGEGVTVVKFKAL